jgi:serpin B
VEIDDQLVERRLTELTTASTRRESWLEPSEIRRQGRKLRIRRRATGIGSAVVVVVLLATLVPIGLRGRAQPEVGLRVSAALGPAVQLVSTARGGGPTPTGAIPTAVAQSEQQFSLSLLKELSASGTSSSNVLVSPASLSTALSMLELGARGDTESQIAAALDSRDLTAQQQAAGWSALSAELALAGASGGISVQSANSLWLQKGLAMDPIFMSSLSRYFASGIWQVDFASNPAGAIDALNRWVTQKTRGHITSLFAPGTITNQTALILANAVYFKAAWQEPFTGATSDGSFRLPNGTTTSVPYLHTPVNGPLDGSAFVGSGVDAVQLPYRGGRLAALIIMPTSQPISEFSASLSQAGLAHIVSGLAPSALDLAMPSFSLTASHELVPTLKSLGMENAFDPGPADFSGMTSTPLVVTDVAQKDTLRVTRWGSEASAATGISMASSARRAALALVIDRPYLFLIRDQQTGEILFEAQVVDPAQS